MASESDYGPGRRVRGGDYAGEGKRSCYGGRESFVGGSDFIFSVRGTIGSRKTHRERERERKKRKERERERKKEKERERERERERLGPQLIGC